MRIGYFNVYASELLAQPLSRMRREAPRAQVELVDLPPRCWRMRFRPARLIWRCSDVEPTTARRFETRALAIVPMLLALPTGDPLAKHRRLALAQLRDTPFIGYTEKEFPGRPALLQRACRAAGFEPRIIRRVDSLMSMLLAVGTGEGAGFGAEYLKCMPHNGVVFRR